MSRRRIGELPREPASRRRERQCKPVGGRLCERHSIPCIECKRVA